MNYEQELSCLLAFIDLIHSLIFELDPIHMKYNIGNLYMFIILYQTYCGFRVVIKSILLFHNEPIYNFVITIIHN
jgi:hypothetical protein